MRPQLACGLLVRTVCSGANARPRLPARCSVRYGCWCAGHCTIWSLRVLSVGLRRAPSLATLPKATALASPIFMPFCMRRLHHCAGFGERWGTPAK